MRIGAIISVCSFLTYSYQFLSKNCWRRSCAIDCTFRQIQILFTVMLYETVVSIIRCRDSEIYALVMRCENRQGYKSRLINGRRLRTDADEPSKGTTTPGRPRRYEKRRNDTPFIEIRGFTARLLCQTSRKSSWWNNYNI